MLTQIIHSEVNCLRPWGTWIDLRPKKREADQTSHKLFWSLCDSSEKLDFQRDRKREWRSGHHTLQWSASHADMERKPTKHRIGYPGISGFGWVFFGCLDLGPEKEYAEAATTHSTQQTMAEYQFRSEASQVQFNQSVIQSFIHSFIHTKLNCSLP